MGLTSGQATTLLNNYVDALISENLSLYRGFDGTSAQDTILSGLRTTLLTHGITASALDAYAKGRLTQAAGLTCYPTDDAILATAQAALITSMTGN